VVAPQRANVEAKLVQQLPERALGEEAQVGRERVEAVVEAANQQPEGRAAAVSWRSDGEGAAWAQHPSRLAQQELYVPHVLDRLGAEHEVELRAFERKRIVGVELHQLRAVAQPSARTLEREGRDVGGHDLPSLKLAGEATVAAAEVERPLHIAQRAHELPQVRRRGPAPDFRHEIPELIVISARHGRESCHRHHPRTLGGNESRLESEMSEELTVTPPGARLIEEFVNTHELGEPDGEQLIDADALREWLAERDLLPAGATVRDDDLARAHRVREALRKLLLANNGAPLQQNAVATLNAAADESHLRVVFSPAGMADLVPDDSNVPGALARILGVAYTSIADESWQRLKACRLDDCQYAFYDHSKNRSRTWCSMKVCGNRAKARAYRERQRG
jgi:predicted RNA-binding Zn ribbon-like protein